MKTNRILSILLGVLILINAFLLIQFKRSNHHGHPPHRPKLSLLLKMTGKEAQWVDAEFEQHIQEKEKLLTEQKRLRSQVVLKENYPENQLLYTAISKLQFKIDSCTFNHFARVKSHCTAKQAKKLTEIVKRMIERQDRPGPKR